MWSYHEWSVAAVLMSMLACVVTQSIDNEDSTCELLTNTGRDFYIGIPYIRNGYGDRGTAFFINIAAESDGQVTVFYKLLNESIQYIVANGGISVQVPDVYTLPKLNTTQQYGIYITSDVEVSVSVLAKPLANHQGMDGYLALPLTSLSTTHIVASYKPYSSFFPVEILVIATANNTHVSISVPKAQTTSEVNITMNRLDTYTLSEGHDLSRTTVTSDKPVAVISAIGLAHVGNDGRSGGQSSFEWIVPAELSGLRFLVPRLPTIPYYVLKLFPVENNTQVMFRNASGNYTMALFTDISYEFSFETWLYIQADKPLLVYQYGPSNNGHTGSFIRNIPALENYIDKVGFVIQSTVPEAMDVLQIVMPRNASLFLDGIPITSFKTISNDYVYVNGLYYEVLSIVLQKSSSLQNKTDYHQLYSNGTAGLFGAMVFGFITDKQDAYGYPLEQARKVCRQNLSPQMTKPTSMSSSGNPPLTTNIMSSSGHPQLTTSKIITSSGQGVLCLDCNDLEELYFCDVYKKCEATQVCFVEKYQTHAAQYRYRTGCANSDKCPSSSPVKRQTEVTQCFECCQGNFCNTNGCGAKGLTILLCMPPRDDRGPLCLNCLHSSSVDACKTLSFCEANEVCSIRVAKVFGAVRQYSMGCAHKDCDTQEHKRSPLLCAHCCGDDFCNNECRNSSFIESAIIG